MEKIALAICTHNPDDLVFEEVLRSVEKILESPYVELEGIIIDNNSKSPLRGKTYISEFLNRNNWFRIVEESQPGLSYARFAALNNTEAAWMIFCDDDNILDPKYLQNSFDLISDFKKVGVWGPGNIEVKYIDNVTSWISKNKRLFQHRSLEEVRLNNQPAIWKNYPAGTGMLIKREILKKYFDDFKSGRFTALGRSGKSLSSGEDVHMVWTAIEMGYFAGLAPSLRLKHMIGKSKSNFDYIKKVVYGRASSYIQVCVEFYPELKYKYPDWSSNYLLLKILRSFLNNISKGIRPTILLITRNLGVYIGVKSLHGTDPSKFYNLLMKILRLN